MQSLYIPTPLPPSFQLNPLALTDVIMSMEHIKEFGKQSQHLTFVPSPPNTVPANCLPSAEGTRGPSINNMMLFFKSIFYMPIPLCHGSFVIVGHVNWNPPSPCRIMSFMDNAGAGTGFQKGGGDLGNC